METFAAIWAQRQSGEDTENAILERILGVQKAAPPKAASTALPAANQPAGRGILNTQFGVTFRHGFEIFRVYNGKRFSAVVQDGRWLMDGNFYLSLRDLSEAVVEGYENSWENWKYRDVDGEEKLIDALRFAESVRSGEVTLN